MKLLLRLLALFFLLASNAVALWAEKEGIFKMQNRSPVTQSIGYT